VPFEDVSSWQRKLTPPPANLLDMVLIVLHKRGGSAEAILVWACALLLCHHVVGGCR